MRKYIIDLSEKIKSHDLFCDCEDDTQELISEESWAAEKNKGKKLNKPFRTPGGPKKFSVYVKNEKGNVVKVNFGDPNMSIKRDSPERRKSFRARHNCDNPGPKTKARYWSCRQWRAGSKVEGSSSEEEYNKIILEELDESEGAKKRAGRKSGAQTPAKPSERKKGSSKNKPGSAAKKGSSITFSEKVINALKTKVSEHNKKHPSKKVTLGQLKKVYRRGAGAFSSSHRPGMSRGGWAMARVNMFLKMKRGGKVKKSYRAADQDISKAFEGDFDFEYSEEDFTEANIDIEKYDLKDEDFSEDIFPEESDAELTKEQKTLPEFLQKKILEKKGKSPKSKKKEDKKSKEKSEAGHNMSKYSFDNPGEAMKMAKKMGLSGVHTHGEGDDTVFMPGKNHEDLMKKLDNPEESKAGHGLWHNIQLKKQRMGKNYRPAKPGDKDRPSKDALKKAQKSSKKKKM